MAYPPPLDKIIGDYMKIEIEALMFRLRMGEITVEEWQTALINLLGIGGAAAYMAGLGQDDLNDKQKDALGEFVDGQMKFVAGFAAAMALWLIAHGLKDKFDPNIPIPEEETDPWAKWRARAQLYAPTVASIYWQGRTEDLPLPAMPGDGTSQCLTNCRCEWKIVDVDHENGDFDAYWLYDDDPEVRHCQTCLQRSEDWNPLQIRNWELVLPHMREARQAAEQLRVKFHTALKGGSGSGNFNHRGRPGKVGGSAARVTVHKSLDEFLNSQHPFQSIYAFFVSTYGEVLSATDASLGGHEMIARGLAKNPKYDIDKKMAKEHDFEMAAVSSGKLIRCELSAGKKTLYVQANPFTTKHLHALQAIILNNPGIEKVVIEGWRVGDIYSPDYAVIRRGEVTFDEFISANKVIIRDSEVGLKERLKGGNGSGNFNHAGRPGEVGGSTPASFDEGFVDSYEQLTNSEYGKAFLITPDDRLINTPKGHPHFLIHHRDHWNYLGITPEDGNPKYPNDMTKPMLAAYKAGTIRIREMDKPAIYTQRVDNSTLRRLQRLVNEGKIRLDKSYNTWTSGTKYITFTAAEFMAASKVIIDPVSREPILKEHRLKGGPGSGFFAEDGHRGRPGLVGGSVARTGYSEVRQVRWGTSLTKGYFIMPSGETYDIGRDHWRGLSEALGTPVFERLGFDKSDELNMDNIWKAMKRGLIRVREVNHSTLHDEINIDTFSIDTPTLRRLQRLHDNGAWDAAPEAIITWSGQSKQGYINTTLKELLEARFVSLEDGFLALKESSGRGVKFHAVLKGGPGSGNFGHAGRPGLVGGSAPETEGIVIEWSNTGSGEWTGECGDYLITIREDNGFYRHKIYDGRQQLREKGLSEDLDGAKESARQDLNRIIEADDTEPEIAIRPMVFDNAEQMFNALREWKASEGLGLNAVGTWGYFIGRNGKVLSFPGQYEHIDALRLIQTEYPDISKAMGIEDEIESQKPTGFAPNDISPALQEKLTRVRIIFSNIGDAISISTAEMSRPELKRLQGYFDKGYIPKVNSNGRRPKIEWTSYLTWGDRFGEILTNLDDFMAASGIRRTPTDYDRTILELKEIVKRKFKGGPGSGNFGHAGIPGHRGGSAPDDTFVFTKTKYYNDTEENIRDTIAKMLPAANEYYGNRYKDYTPERYMEECNQRLREILANAEVCVRITEDNLNEVLDDGVYESVFSTRRSAAGMYNNASKRKYLSYRKEFENKVFGIEDDQKEGRPVYGFLVDGLSDGVDTSYSNMTLQMYGNVTIVLNGSVKDRSTWTDADSLDYAFREVPSYHGKMVYRALPTPITNPSVISSIEPASGTDILAVYNESRTGGMGGSYGYWEAQIHGGFRLSDIKEVVFQNQPSEQTAERLARNGIPWRIAKKAGVKP